MNHTEYIIPIGEEAKDFDEIFIGVLRKHKELIRCKDCKYAKCIEQNDDWWECSHDRYDALIDNRVMHGDDFCSRAERKEE